MPSHSPRSTRRFSTAAPLFRHRALTRLSWWIRPDKPPAIVARVGVVTEIAPERGDAPLPIAAYDWVVDATGSPGISLRHRHDPSRARAAHQIVSL